MTIDTCITFNSLKQGVTLQSSTSRIFAYGAWTQLPILRRFSVTLESHQKFHCTIVYIVEGRSGCLFSYKSASALSFIQLLINHMEGKDRPIYKQLIKEFSTVFYAIDVLKDYEVNLDIHSSVPPVAQPARRIPFHLRKNVEEELCQLDHQGIIKKMEGPKERWQCTIMF